jgi:hypothetical protein
MKKNRVAVSVTAMVFLLSIPSCLEYNVKTEVAPDGSSKRTITVGKLDRMTLPQTAFPVPVSGRSWDIQIKELPEGKQTKYEYTARKEFRSPEELEQEYAHTPDTAYMEVKVSLKKRFEWFYTYFDYQESYHLRYPFSAIPITNVLTQEEINRFLYSRMETVEDSVLDARVTNWDRENKNDELFQLLKKVFEQSSDPQLSVVRLMKNKQRVISLLDVKEDSAKNVRNPDPVDFVLKCLEEALRTKAVYKLRNEVAVALAEHDKKNHVLNRAVGVYQNIIQLPGLLLSANSEEIEGNAVQWSVRDNQLKVGTFVMKARSRVTNTWAFALTGIVGLIVVIIVVRTMLKGKAR